MICIAAFGDLIFTKKLLKIRDGFEKRKSELMYAYLNENDRSAKNLVNYSNFTSQKVDSKSHLFFLFFFLGPI